MAFLILESILVSTPALENSMPLDPIECSENAMRCRKLATETTDPRVQDLLVEIAHGWDRLASKLANTDELLAKSCNQERAA